MTFQVAHPELDFRESVNKLRAAEFFTLRFQCADIAVIVFLELICAGVSGVIGITFVSEAVFGGDDYRRFAFGQKEVFVSTAVGALPVTINLRRGGIFEGIFVVKKHLYRNAARLNQMLDKVSQERERFALQNILMDNGSVQPFGEFGSIPTFIGCEVKHLLMQFAEEVHLDLPCTRDTDFATHAGVEFRRELFFRELGIAFRERPRCLQESRCLKIKEHRVALNNELRHLKDFAAFNRRGFNVIPRLVGKERENGLLGCVADELGCRLFLKSVLDEPIG